MISQASNDATVTPCGGVKLRVVLVFSEWHPPLGITEDAADEPLIPFLEVTLLYDNVTRPGRVPGTFNGSPNVGWLGL
jgi:hypothetical protein